jgi:hypothetical protein
MTVDPLGPLFVDTRRNEPEGGADPTLRESRAPLLFAAAIQFLIAAVAGFIGIRWCVSLILVAFPLPEWYAPGVALTAAAVFHVILGIGVIRLRRWAMITSVWVSVIYLMIAFVFSSPSEDFPGYDWAQGPAIALFALIVSADIATLLQLKRAS